MSDLYPKNPKMKKIVAKPTTASEDQSSTDRTFMDWMEDGHKWAVTSDFFDVQKFVNKVGWNVPYSHQRPWSKCPFPDLRETLESKGQHYTVGFIRAVQNSFQAEYSALVFLRYREGTENGRKWASEYASDELLVRIREYAQLEISRRVFVHSYPHEFYPLWTPAHVLLEFIYDNTCPSSEDGELHFDSSEFRDFWQPFVNEPMNKVLANLEQYGHRAGHKLQDHHYIAGFVDGALGHTEQLERRLNERTPIPPPKDGSISGE